MSAKRSPAKPLQHLEQGWDAKTFAHRLGVEDRSPTTRQLEHARLADAAADPATGGMVHLTTDITYGKNATPLNLQVRFSTFEIDNTYSCQAVFDIQMRQSRDKKQVLPKKITFLNRTLYDEARDGDDFNVAALNHIWQAVQDINRRMRPGFTGSHQDKSPGTLLKILKNNNLDDVFGEGLDDIFPHINSDGEFNFELKGGFNSRAQEQANILRFPNLGFAQAAMGDRQINTLDYKASFEAPIATATHKNTGQAFDAQSKRHQSPAKQRLTQNASLQPAGPKMASDHVAKGIPSLFRLEFRATALRRDGAEIPQKLHNLSFLGRNKKNEDRLTYARFLEFIRRFNEDMAEGRYPQIASHLVNCRLTDHANDLEPPERGTSRAYIKRHMGNDSKKSIAGIGDGLGDCTEIMIEDVNDDGEYSQFGVVIDCGASIPPRGSEYSLAVPDLQDSLNNFDTVIITHKHLDHKDGLGPYVDYGMFASPEFYERMNDGEYTGKTICATPNVLEHFRLMLDKNQVPKELRPKMRELKGKGWIHIKSPHTGKTIISAQYSAESSPHSARSTPLRIIVRNGNDFKFSLFKPGDFRYGKHLVEGNTSPLAVGKLIDEVFVSEGPEALLAEQHRELQEKEAALAEVQAHLTRDYLEAHEIAALEDKRIMLEQDLIDYKSQMIPEEMLLGRRDILELDGTNDKQPGWAPTELEVEENELEIMSWFPEMAVLNQMISTNDSRFETELRIAVRSGRDISVGGTNLVDSKRVTNKHGVNKDLDEADAQYIQNYLDDRYIELHKITPDTEIERLTDQYFKLKRKSTTTEDGSYTEGRDDFIRGYAKALDKDDYRTLCFNILRRMSQCNNRYDARIEMEDAYAQSQPTVPNDTIKLGPICAGYESQTFARMVKDAPARVKFLMTGTQGTPTEAEAWWPKHISGRGVFNANHKNRKTARPLKRGQYFAISGQTSIPGNESDVHDMDERAAETLGIPHSRAQGRGFVLRSIDSPERKQHIETRLRAQNKHFEYEGDNLVVHDMPIHATGHGYQYDNDALIALNAPEMVTINHCADEQTVAECMTRMQEKNIKTPGDMIRSFTLHTYDMGKKHGDITYKKLGRTFASMVLVTQVKEWLKQYGGYGLAERAVAIDNEGGVLHDALLAGETFNPETGSHVLSEHFGGIDQDIEDYESENNRDAVQRRSPADVSAAHEDKRYAGALNPKKGRPVLGFDDLLDTLGLSDAAP